MRNYLKNRRKYWAEHPRRPLIVGISAVLSIFLVVVCYLKFHYFAHGDDRCWAMLPIVTLGMMWLKYGYDKLTL